MMSGQDYILKIENKDTRSEIFFQANKLSVTGLEPFSISRLSRCTLRLTIVVVSPCAGILMEPLARMLQKYDTRVCTKPKKMLENKFPPPKYRPRTDEHNNVVNNIKFCFVHGVTSGKRETVLTPE